MPRLLVPLLMFALSACSAGRGDFSAALASLDEFDAAIKATAEAAAKNDAATAGEQQNKAQLALARAAKQFESAGIAHCQDPALLQKYAETRMRLQDYDLAAEALQTLTALSPQSPERWLMLGRALSELGSSRANEALTALRRALESEPDVTVAAGAHYVIGRVYRNERLFNFARDHFAAAVQADPAAVAARISLAGEKLRAGEVAAAAAELDQLGPVAPEFALQLQDVIRDAVEGFNASRGVFPDTAANHMAYAGLLFRANRVRQSLMAAERSATLDPDNYATWNFIGDISRQTGAIDRARQAYENSLKIKPDQPVTRQALQELMQKTGAAP